MTRTIEELQAASNATEGIEFGAFMIEHPQEAQTIRAVLEAAISKMETTTDTECLCCGGTDGKCLSKDGNGLKPCQVCGGDGYVIGTDMDCCGNFLDTGECGGTCAIQVECQEQCSGCGGSGYMNTRAEQPAVDGWHTDTPPKDGSRIIVADGVAIDSDGRETDLGAAVAFWHSDAETFMLCTFSGMQSFDVKSFSRWKPLERTLTKREGV